MLTRDHRRRGLHREPERHQLRRATLSPYDTTMPAAGRWRIGCSDHAGRVQLRHDIPGPNWISVTSGGSGVGPGTLVYSVAPNSTTTARSGSLTIGGQTFQVNQDGLACSVTLTPSAAESLCRQRRRRLASRSPPTARTALECVQQRRVRVRDAIGGHWKRHGVRDRGLEYRFGRRPAPPSCSSMARTCRPPIRPDTACTYSLQSIDGVVPCRGRRSARSVSIAPSSACSWPAVSNAPSWLAIVSSGSAGSGERQLRGASRTPAAAPRTGTLTVAGLTYTVNQAAAPCSYTTAPIAGQREPRPARPGRRSPSRQRRAVARRRR